MPDFGHFLRGFLNLPDPKMTPTWLFSGTRWALGWVKIWKKVCWKIPIFVDIRAFYPFCYYAQRPKTAICCISAPCDSNPKLLGIIYVPHGSINWHKFHPKKFFSGFKILWISQIVCVKTQFHFRVKNGSCKTGDYFVKFPTKCFKVTKKLRHDP